MKDVAEYCPTDKKDWREWLRENHKNKEAVWVIFYKKRSINFNLSWSDAVDEALCFGWIDSVKKTIDSEKYRQYFSKRKPNSTWSKVNKDKITFLTSKNLMHSSGYNVIKVAKENGSWSILDTVEALIIPDNLLKELNSRVGALAFYESLSKSEKKILLSWIALAKREETKQKRTIEIAENASKHTKPKQFR